MRNLFQKTLFLVLIFSTGKCIAQSGEPVSVTSVFRANVLNPGLSYEFPFGPKQTVIVNGGLNTGFGFNYSSSIGTSAFISFDPIIGAAYRYYYNGRKRFEKGKRTSLNSMNYLSPVYSILYSDYQIDNDAIGAESDLRAVHTVGLVWGIQRNYNSRISLDLNMGGGYIFGSSTFYDSNNQKVVKTTGRPNLIIQFQLGFWLNRRQKSNG